MSENEKKNKSGIDMSRRAFLKLAGAGAAACAMAAIPVAAQAAGNPHNVRVEAII